MIRRTEKIRAGAVRALGLAALAVALTAAPARASVSSAGTVAVAEMSRDLCSLYGRSFYAALRDYQFAEAAHWWRRYAGAGCYASL